MNEQMIRDAYARIRTIDHTIPDDVLDFMKDAAIEKLKEEQGVRRNSKPKEFILCAAIKIDGSIINAHRHSDCYELLAELSPNPVDLPNRKDQGFLTSDNRFVDRKEGFKIAKANNQIYHTLHDGVSENDLTSEDLY